MDSKRVYLGLDVGEQRIGVAQGDSVGRIAQPLRAVAVDGHEITTLQSIIGECDATDLVVGKPRNQSGEETQQTRRIREFAITRLKQTGLPIHWQDESVTSIIAEERLVARKKSYSKGDIDAEAASIILQDYLEQL